MNFWISRFTRSFAPPRPADFHLRPAPPRPADFGPRPAPLEKAPPRTSLPSTHPSTYPPTHQPHLNLNLNLPTYPPITCKYIQSTLKRVSFSGSLCHHHAFFKIPFESNSLKFIHICPLSNYSPSSGAFQAPSPYPALSSLPWSPPSPSSPIRPTTKCRACCFFSLHHLLPTHHQSLATITPRPLVIFIDFSFYLCGIYIVAFSCGVFHFWPIWKQHGQ